MKKSVLLIFASISLFTFSQEQKSGSQSDPSTNKNPFHVFTKAEELAFQHAFHDKATSVCDDTLAVPPVQIQDCGDVGTPAFYTNATDLNLMGMNQATPPTIPTSCISPYTNDGSWTRVNPDPGVRAVDLRGVSGAISAGNYSIYVQFFQGTDCNSLVSVGCEKFAQVVMGVWIEFPIHIADIHHDQDLWMYIWSDDPTKTFNLITEMIGTGSLFPINSDCSGAAYNGDFCNLGADNDTWSAPGVNSQACNGGSWISNYNTMYYEFVPTVSSGSISISNVMCNAGETSSMYFGVWKDCACIGTYTPDCFFGCAAGTGTLDLSGLIPGESYLLVVGGQFGYTCVWDINASLNLFNMISCSAAPSIIQQPENALVCSDSATSISVSCAGNEYKFYQWQVNDGTGFTDLYDVPPYAGVYSEVLEINMPTNDMNGYTYQCVIVNDCGTDTTDLAQLTVNCAGLDDQSLEKSISIFPNPAANLLHIQAENLTAFDKIQLVDVLGRVIEEKIILGNEVSWDLKHVSAACYSLRFVGQQHNLVKVLRVMH